MLLCLVVVELVRRLVALANDVTGGRAMDAAAAGANSSLQIWARGRGRSNSDLAHEPRVVSCLSGGFCVAW